MRRNFRKYRLAWLSFAMVAVTIVISGFMAFRYVNTQDNTKVASSSSSQSSKDVAVKAPETGEQVAPPNDVDVVTGELDQLNLDEIDTELDSQFNF